MLPRITAIRLLMAILGLLSIFLIFWIGAKLHLDDSTQMMMALMVATATILIELVISFDSLKDSIETIYPALELSLEDQRSINKVMVLCNELRKNDKSPSAKIALAGFDKTTQILERAEKNNDFIYNDIYEANLIALESLGPNQTFQGISALIKPHFWRSGKMMNRYRQINYGQANKGVNIERIFLFNSEEEVSLMEDIMREQMENKIKVFYAIKSEVSDIIHYPDFSIMQDIGLGLVVHREEMLERVTVTSNPETVGELSAQFELLRSVSHELS